MASIGAAPPPGAGGAGVTSKSKNPHQNCALHVTGIRYACRVMP
jgi:hypothetical protein